MCVYLYMSKRITASPFIVMTYKPWVMSRYYNAFEVYQSVYYECLFLAPTHSIKGKGIFLFNCFQNHLSLRC